MGKKTTEIICILDRSGSMASLAPEVINSFNEFINDQKELPGKAKVTLVLFDNQYDVVHDRIALQEMATLNKDLYFARGMTALNDAIGKTIYGVDKKRKKVIVLIQTDGLENASHEFVNEDIKALVKEKEELGWKFVFLGANVDSFDEGMGRGIKSAVDFDPTADGVKFAYSTMSDTTRAYRSGNNVDDVLNTIKGEKSTDIKA